MSEIERLYRQGLVASTNPMRARLDADLMEALEAYGSRHGSEVESPGELIAIPAGFAAEQLDRLAQLQQARQAFAVRYDKALDDRERNAAILQFAEVMGATGSQARSDARYVGEPFDIDAVLERFRRRRGQCERALSFAAERLAAMATSVQSHMEMADWHVALSTHAAPALERLRAHDGDPRVRAAAYRCLARLGQAAEHARDNFWIDASLRDVRRASLDNTEDCWVQCEALEALFRLDPKSVDGILERRLSAPSTNGSSLVDDNRIFVRRRIAFLLATHLADNRQLEAHHASMSRDEDGAVRQAVAESLPFMPRDMARSSASLLVKDFDPQVRATLLARVGLLAPTLGGRETLDLILELLDDDDDEFVTRCAIAASGEFVDWAVAGDEAETRNWAKALRGQLGNIRQSEAKPRVRRWAGEASERIWLACSEEGREVAGILLDAAHRTSEGKTTRLPEIAPLLARDEALVGRVMAVLAQQDFGLSLSKGKIPRLTRGEVFERRIWRTLYELKQGATDKRQAFYHTIGRVFRGTVIAPSAHLAELAPTAVPGEPLHIASDGGWRNYIPLPDLALSVTDEGEEARIYTSEGITTLSPPRALKERFRIWWQVTRNFAELAELRNTDPRAYVERLTKLGLAIEHKPYPDEEGAEAEAAQDPGVTRLFDVAGVIMVIPLLWDEVAAYVATVYENSLLELAIFLLILALYFFGRHVWKAYRVRQYRRSIALSLGGWGTRGKSGTERLKAALMNSLGAPLVSKTTGCEAMFLLGEPYGDLTELFLFRPYDKATIWEQADLLAIAEGVGARSFLWECMALNPSFVKILQRDWMKDDIATITNTFPDHEDVQGPAGRNVAEVMCEFVPEDSILVTSEEEMLPLLEARAQSFGTRVETVGWRDAGLLHKRLLDRFPYSEHPNNIALVNSMGRELGLDRDYCIKEMADRVVADLGVLKVYPRAEVDGATLEFVMGMSANERFGAMGNWTRMGFADHDLSSDPGVFVTTVVNNRADRVPRSRVFASMIVNDISADRHFLIGSNIEGLLDFIHQEWDDYAASIDLAAAEGGKEAAFDALMKRHRIPRSRKEIEWRLTAMLIEQGEHDTASHITAWKKGDLDASLAEKLAPDIAARMSAHIALLDERLETCLELRGMLDGDLDTLHARLRDVLRERFLSSLVPVRDYYTKGDTLVRQIAHETPPGLHNRIMGLQNIKGTGLDFVYTWQAWDAVHAACEALAGDDPGAVEAGLQTLSGFQEFNALAEAKVRTTIAEVEARGTITDASAARSLAAIVERMDDQLSRRKADFENRSDQDEAKKGGSIASWLTDFSEGFLDASDAIRRRKAAERVYRAVMAEQISSARAALELKRLTIRQKGGWLSGWLTETGNRLRDLPARFARKG
ncbi:hypothetical protein KUW15_12940 [Qipengyuania aquimaris]|uniref:hypothetical protein n=1 Tax=Qipengyuania aquimaris TaxID=255984 RepID=UPI001C96313E|nr:hypothetical protein [Qipengyuania aquimaris]MBY6129620.1 hypothetical protein [Qipengyuania aquimaris]